MPAMAFLIALFAAIAFVWPQYGWPFWPALMAVAATLTAWGYVLGSWRVPAVFLGGYIAMRGVIWGLDPALYETAASLVWISASILLYRVKAWIPGTACACSGLTYPAMHLAGERLSYFGPTAIIAELFLLLAFITIGGGLYERSALFSDSHRANRFVVYRAWMARFALGMAADQRST